MGVKEVQDVVAVLAEHPENLNALSNSTCSLQLLSIALPNQIRACLHPFLSLSKLLEILLEPGSNVDSEGRWQEEFL